MSWYVIQTYTGREERVVEMIQSIVPRRYYDECFVIYSEQLRHRQQGNQIHILQMFPGYIFISTDDIKQFFGYLKTVPAMTKIMASDNFTFTPMWDEEADFLLSIMDSNHVVRLSYVVTDGRNHVIRISEPLEKCKVQIQKYQFHKRYAVIRLQIKGREKEVKMGIILNDDIRKEVVCGIR